MNEGWGSFYSKESKKGKNLKKTFSQLTLLFSGWFLKRGKKGSHK